MQQPVIVALLLLNILLLLWVLVRPQQPTLKYRRLRIVY